MAVLSQISCCVCMDATISCLHESPNIFVVASRPLWLHRGNKVIMAGWRHQSSCGCIEGTISLWLHRSTNHVLAASSQLLRFAESKQQSRCGGLRQPVRCGCIDAIIWIGCIETTSSLWLNLANNFHVDGSNQPPRCSCMEAGNSLWLY